MRRSSPLLFSIVLAACSSEEPKPATITVTAGLESDAFSRSPLPKRLVLQAVSTSGATEEMVNIRWPSNGFDIGDFDPNQVVAFEALGLDEAEKTVLRGATIFHSLQALDGVEVPLFVGRVGETSRPSGSLTVAHEGGVAAIVDARFIVSIGGTSALDPTGPVDPGTFSAYDMGLWSTSTTHKVSRPPRTLAMFRGQQGLMIDDSGANWFDFSTYGTSEARVPDGMSFAEVAGGDVIYGENDVSYVVGATRKKNSSSAVLRIGSDRALSVLRIGTPRQAAAAAYVADRGLLIVGGHETEPGVLLLRPEASSFEPLAFPPDPVRGAAAVDVGGARIVLAGGRIDTTPASTRLLDLNCTGNCEPAELGSDMPPVNIVDAWGTATGPNELVLIGNSGDPVPTTRFERITGVNTTPVLEEIALREPRRGATPIKIFGRSVALVGGVKSDGQGAHHIEIYIPE